MISKENFVIILLINNASLVLMYKGFSDEKRQVLDTNVDVEGVS